MLSVTPHLCRYRIHADISIGCEHKQLIWKPIHSIIGTITRPCLSQGAAQAEAILVIFTYTILLVCITGVSGYCGQLQESVKPAQGSCRAVGAA